MVSAVRGAGAVPVLLGMRIPSNYGARYTEAFHRVFTELAEGEKLPFSPFFLDGVALNPELMQADGIHPNAAAQATMLDNAWPAISEGLSAAREKHGC